MRKPCSCMHTRAILEADKALMSHRLVQEAAHPLLLPLRSQKVLPSRLRAWQPQAARRWHASAPGRSLISPLQA